MNAEEFEVVKAAVEVAGPICIDIPKFGLDLDGLDLKDLDDDMVFDVQDALTDFANYREAAAIRDFEVQGHACRVVARAQAVKGQRRQDILIVDFGAHRAGVIW